MGFNLFGLFGGKKKDVAPATPADSAPAAMPSDAPSSDAGGMA